MVGTLLPYFVFTMLMLGFVAFDRLRRRGQFREPPHNWSNHSGSDGSPSAGFWSGDSGSSWSGGGDGGCSVSGDSGGSCGGDGGGGGGGD
jgi:hypothetical protein